MKRKRGYKIELIVIAVAAFIAGMIIGGLAMLLIDNRDLDQQDESAIVEQIKIETDYVDLYYPKQWEQYLETENKNNSIVFEANIENKKYELFTVYFSEEGDSLIGKMEGSTPVSFSIKEYEPESLEGAVDIVFEMQEAVYEMMEGLVETEAFVPENP